MQTLTVYDSADLISLIKRIEHNGTVEVDRYTQGVRMLPIRTINEPTAFDMLDREIGAGKSGWPPMGPWPNNDASKVVTDIVTHEDVG